MKHTKIAFIILCSYFILSTASAALQTEKTLGQQKIGAISAEGAYKLDNLTEQFSKKADKEVASSFKIVAAGGKNKLYGVADIYK